jgi:phosphate transport system substrate-binding protein
LNPRKLTALAGVALIALVCVSFAAARANRGASHSHAAAGSITGAGSTFVFPLVSQWIPAVQSALGIHVTYGSIGSGAGIAQITARTVDFGASDAPLTPDQFAACKGCVQIPWAASATSVDYNLNGAPNHLHLTGPVLANIFLGKIKRWDDPAIKKLNKGKSLPSTPITVVHRSDGSGTTYNFTDYLSKVSREWRSKVGKSTAVNWPTGIGGKGNSGVSGVLANTNGGIAYTDVAYALKNHFKQAAIKNRGGKYQIAGLNSIREAMATITRVAPNNGGISIVDPAKSHPLAYPICTFTYVIVPKQTAKAAELKQFIRWALTKGQSYGPRLLFVPLPRVVLNASVKTMALIK